MNLILYKYLIIVNLLTFVVFAIDKRKAQKGKWRIHTKTLMGLSLIGGTIGGLAAMYIFHHKTKQKKFSLGLPIMLTIQITLLVCLHNIKWIDLNSFV